MPFRKKNAASTAATTTARVEGAAAAVGSEEGGRSLEDVDVEVITLGAGCFWCLDAAARRIKGFISSTVGYAGGTGPAPTYWELHSTGSDAGWIEAVQLVFDTRLISIAQVIDLFFQSHDPTTPNQDGANYGPEYHSTIFYNTEDQKAIAENMIQVWSSRLNQPVVTSLVPFSTFVRAESEHQDFYNQNPRSAYCRVIIAPKLKKLDLL